MGIQKMEEALKFHRSLLERFEHLYSSLSQILKATETSK
jgi:hypothetical protein